MPVGFSKVTICNLALSNTGSKSTIESIDEDNPPAKICKLWYEPARIASLEAFNWSFARSSIILATHSVAAPTYRWAYRYQYPAGCVRARYIENPLGTDADPVPYEVEEGDTDTLSIVTDQDDAVLIYTRDVSSVSKFSMHFLLLMSMQLGVFICPELTGKISRRDRIQKDLQDMILNAPVADTEESAPKQAPDASWIKARV